MYFSIQNRPLLLGFFCFLALLVSACGTAQHTANLETGYSPPSDVKIQLGEIENSTGRVYDVDVETMLTDALSEALQNENLLATSADSNVLILDAEILAYEKGSAFERWLMPGAGSTLLEVQCELRDGDKVVGVAHAKRTVDAGGGYTIGAWASIYKNVATDITEDFSARFDFNAARLDFNARLGKAYRDGGRDSTTDLKQASAPSLGSQTQQTPIDNTTLKVAIFYTLGDTGRGAENMLINFAEGHIKRHNRLELEYSYYSDNFDVVEPGTKLWVGRAKRQPIKENVYRAGAQIDADVVLMYYLFTYSHNGGYIGGDSSIEIFVFDMKNRREYHSESNGKTYKQETEWLFEIVLRNNGL